MNSTFITSYERDNETDLDFAQARMHNYNHGRFTSPDSFTNDSEVSNPQSWNLYIYVRNNPLNLIDPTGMYIWSNELGGDAETDEELRDFFTNSANKIKDKKKRNKALKNLNKTIEKVKDQREKIKAAIIRAKESLNGLEGAEREMVSNALNAYGEEFEDNNVVLGQKGTGAKGGATWFGENNKIFVLLGNVGEDELAMQFAHEGSHVVDFQNFNAGITGSDINVLESEKRAFLVHSYTAKGLGEENYTHQGVKIYKKGWSEAKIKTQIGLRLQKGSYAKSKNPKLSQVKIDNIKFVGGRDPSWY